MKDRIYEGYAHQTETIAGEIFPRRELTPTQRLQVELLGRHVERAARRPKFFTSIFNLVKTFSADMIDTHSGALKDVPKTVAAAIQTRPEVLARLNPVEIRMLLDLSLGVIIRHEYECSAQSQKGAKVEGRDKIREELSRWTQIHKDRAEEWLKIRNRLREPASTTTSFQRA